MNETKMSIMAIIEKLPDKDENDIADIVEDMVRRKLLPPSSPPAITNHAVNSALFIINKWLKKVEEK